MHLLIKSFQVGSRRIFVKVSDISFEWAMGDDLLCILTRKMVNSKLRKSYTGSHRSPLPSPAGIPIEKKGGGLIFHTQSVGELNYLRLENISFEGYDSP